MSNNNQTLTEGHYLRIVVGLNPQCATTCLLDAAFANGTTVSDGECVIYALCKSKDCAKILKRKIDDKSILGAAQNSFSIGIDNEEGVVKIIDPHTLKNLGDHVNFTIRNRDKRAVTQGEITIIARFIDPPEWVPIENDKKLRIHGKGEAIFLSIIDRRLGEIVYRSDVIEITGADLRVYGEQIKYEKGEKISTEVHGVGSGSYCELEVQGTGLKIKDIRTSDVERITIRTGKKIKAVVEPAQTDQEKKRVIKSGTGGLCGWVSLFGLEFLFLLALTALPFMPFVAKEHGGLDRLGGNFATNETVVVTCTVPAKVKNTLSLQADAQAFLPHNSKTNSVGATATSISSTSDMPTTAKEFKRIGEGRITFYFVLACLLYVIFYGVVVYLMVLTVHALKRCRKLHGNMQSVIDALRNERDKEKRKAMQKKILDDMIDTYLDKPSSED